MTHRANPPIRWPSETWMGALLCLAALFTPPDVAEGQTVRGRVFDVQNDRPLANAHVGLLDGSGDRRAETNADGTGRYLLAVPEPGFYRIRADQLGYEIYESETFEIGSVTEVRSVDLPLAPSPIPVPRVEVSVDQVNRRLRELLGVNPTQLRNRPIRAATIREHAMRGNSLSEMIRSLQIPNMRVLGGRQGACYQFRGRGCLPAYLDGTRLSRAPEEVVSLGMLSTVVVLLPNELIAYPLGAVHLYTVGLMR